MEYEVSVVGCEVSGVELVWVWVHLCEVWGQWCGVQSQGVWSVGLVGRGWGHGMETMVSVVWGPWCRMRVRG